MNELRKNVYFYYRISHPHINSRPGNKTICGIAIRAPQSVPISDQPTHSTISCHLHRRDRTRSRFHSIPFPETTIKPTPKFLPRNPQPPSSPPFHPSLPCSIALSPRKRKNALTLLIEHKFHSERDSKTSSKPRSRCKKRNAAYKTTIIIPMWNRPHS